MSNFDSAVFTWVIRGEGVPPHSDATERAGQLLGGVAGMWLHYSLHWWLVSHEKEQKKPLTDEEIIGLVQQWESQHPGFLADCALRARESRDRRLGCLPAAQRKLFHKRFEGRCPQCGEPIEEGAYS